MLQDGFAEGFGVGKEDPQTVSFNSSSCPVSLSSRSILEKQFAIEPPNEERVQIKRRQEPQALDPDTRPHYPL